MKESIDVEELEDTSELPSPVPLEKTARTLGDKTAAELGIELPVAALLKFSSSQPSLTMKPKESPRFLVADNNLFQAYSAKVILERRGVSVTLCFDGAQVLQALEKQAFDAVFIDIEMPTMSGIEATARIRATEIRTGRKHFSKMLIFGMVTERMANPSCLGLCRDAGMDRYILKPLLVHVPMFCKMFVLADNFLDFRTVIANRNWVSRYNEICSLFGNTSATGTAEFSAFTHQKEREQLELISSLSEEGWERAEMLRHFTRQKREEVANLEFKFTNLEKEMRKLRLKLTESGSETGVVGGRSQVARDSLFVQKRDGIEKEWKTKLEVLQHRNETLENHLLQTKMDLRNMIESGGIAAQKREQKLHGKVFARTKLLRKLEQSLMENEGIRSMSMRDNYCESVLPLWDHSSHLKNSYFKAELQDMGAIAQQFAQSCATEFNLILKNIIRRISNVVSDEILMKHLEITADKYSTELGYTADNFTKETTQLQSRFTTRELDLWGRLATPMQYEFTTDFAAANIYSSIRKDLVSTLTQTSDPCSDEDDSRSNSSLPTSTRPTFITEGGDVPEKTRPRMKISELKVARGEEIIKTLLDHLLSTRRTIQTQTMASSELFIPLLKTLTRNSAGSFKELNLQPLEAIGNFPVWEPSSSSNEDDEDLNEIRRKRKSVILKPGVENPPGPDNASQLVFLKDLNAAVAAAIEELRDAYADLKKENIGLVSTIESQTTKINKYKKYATSSYLVRTETKEKTSSGRLTTDLLSSAVRRSVLGSRGDKRSRRKSGGSVVSYCSDISDMQDFDLNEELSFSVEDKVLTSPDQSQSAQPQLHPQDSNSEITSKDSNQNINTRIQSSSDSIKKRSSPVQNDKASSSQNSEIPNAPLEIVEQSNKQDSSDYQHSEVLDNTKHNEPTEQNPADEAKELKKEAKEETKKPNSEQHNAGSEPPSKVQHVQKEAIVELDPETKAMLEANYKEQLEAMLKDKLSAYDERLNKQLQLQLQAAQSQIEVEAKQRSSSISRSRTSEAWRGKAERSPNFSVGTVTENLTLTKKAASRNSVSAASRVPSLPSIAAGIDAAVGSISNVSNDTTTITTKLSSLTSENGKITTPVSCHNQTSAHTGLISFGEPLTTNITSGEQLSPLSAMTAVSNSRHPMPSPPTARKLNHSEQLQKAFSMRQSGKLQSPKCALRSSFQLQGGGAEMLKARYSPSPKLRPWNESSEHSDNRSPSPAPPKDQGKLYIGKLGPGPKRSPHARMIEAIGLQRNWEAVDLRPVPPGGYQHQLKAQVLAGGQAAENTSGEVTNNQLVVKSRILGVNGRRPPPPHTKQTIKKATISGSQNTQEISHGVVFQPDNSRQEDTIKNWMTNAHPESPKNIVKRNRLLKSRARLQGLSCGSEEQPSSSAALVFASAVRTKSSPKELQRKVKSSNRTKLSGGIQHKKNVVNNNIDNDGSINISPLLVPRQPTFTS